MSKIIIIGGGIAGLSAGIYARKAGFETTIYEKNGVPGGNCSGWNRNGYHIDNCIHWMTGTREGSTQNRIWHEVGALTDSMNLIKRDSFYVSEWNGQQIALWRDVERTRQEMLAISPEDEKEINCFIDYVRLADTVLTSRQEPKELLHTIDEMTFSLTHAEMAKAFIQYIGLNLEELAMKFKHPLLQHIFLDFMAKEYEAYWLLLAYSFFVSGNGDLPEGGSMGVVHHMTETYRSLGGKLELNTPVEQILINKEKLSIEPPIDKNTLKTKKAKKADCQKCRWRPSLQRKDSLCRLYHLCLRHQLYLPAAAEEVVYSKINQEGILQQEGLSALQLLSGCFLCGRTS